MLKKIVIIGISVISAFSSLHAESLKKSQPHFYIQMENQSNKNAVLSFQQVRGYVFLTPELINQTPLAAHQTSTKYSVTLAPVSPESKFSIVFTGKQDCTYTVGYYSAGNPTIAMQGPGCAGGGYQIVGNTLLLTMTDIHAQSSPL